MQSNQLPSDEKNRLKALQSYNVLDSLAENEFDDITVLASQICGTKIALISLIDEKRQWFKSKVGLGVDETPRELAFCNHAIQDQSNPFIVEDSRIDERFKNNPLVTGDPHVIFYAGIPLISEDNYALGTLCVIDDTPKSLSDWQLTSLKTLSKSVMNLLELRKKNAELARERAYLVDSLEFCNPFYLILSVEGKVEKLGEKLSKIEPKLIEGANFFDFYEFLAPFDWQYWISESSPVQNRLNFFQSLDGKQRFKFSIKQHTNHFIVAPIPLINAAFSLKNYHLTLNDFSKHDYIAEFLFLQQSTERSLLDSKNLLLKTQEKNTALQRANEQVDLLARFPAENPNPIIRLNSDLSLSYINEAAKKYFQEDFKISEKGIGDLELKGYLEELLRHGQDVIKFISKRNQHHYNISLRNVQDKGYLNIYASDITNFINQVERKEEELKELSSKIQEQKEFYEFVLNSIPTDIAVFSTDHKYLFVNPKGIKNPEIRSYMIGKDDYDYCAFRGISTELADRRRQFFNDVMSSGTFKDWIDDIIDSEGNRNVIQRRIGPLKDDSGNIKYVVGYGMEITAVKLAEEKLIQSNKQLKLLENFLNKTTDAIQVSDLKGNMIYINETASERFGIPMNEVSNYNIRDIEKYFVNDQVWLEHIDFIRKNRVFKVELENIHQLTKEKTPVELNVVCEEIDGQAYLISASRDITDRKNSEREIELKANLQRILVEVSSKYINIPIESVNSSINESLARIGQFVDVDRVYVFEYDFHTETSSNIYEWCGHGIESQIANLQKIPFTDIPVWVKKHLKGESVIVSNIAELPQTTFRDLLESQDIKSLIALPLADQDGCIGFVGFDSVRALRSFNDDERDLLELFAQMLLNVSRRTENFRKIEKARNEIEEINTGLERQVQEKTKINIDLAKSISDQEKLVTIGEISSGIAHDLNTPLGAIKSGAENIRYTLEALFQDTIWKCSKDQISLACQRATETEIEFFVGGLQQRREINKFNSFLAETYPQFSNKEIELFANGFVKNRIAVSDIELIKKVLSSDNPLEYFDLLFHIQMTRNFLDTILSSGEKASRVINDLRSFIKEQKSSDKSTVNLNQNIATVLNIFSYELKSNIEVQFNVDSQIEVLGIDIRLFQLWSNLIKNAVESMSEMKDKGLLRIISSNSATHIQISVENNGPMIPHEIQDRIFEKFFTTKGHKNGTGLGLSIINSVLQEHNAELDLFSNDLVTKFIVKFKK